jgi:hypothetical protein
LYKREFIYIHRDLSEKLSDWDSILAGFMFVKSGLDTAGAAEVPMNPAHVVQDSEGVQDDSANFKPHQSPRTSLANGPDVSETGPVPTKEHLE